METKNREKTLLIVVAVCVGLYLLNLFVITPVYGVWKERQASIAKLRKTIARGKATIDDAANIDARWKKMNDNTLSPDVTIAERRLFKSFADFASKSYVVLAGQKPENKDSNDDPEYRNEEWHADVTGNVQQIEQFLYAVESSPLGLKVEDVDFNTRDDYGRQFAVGLTVSGLVLLNTATNATQ